MSQLKSARFELALQSARWAARAFRFENPQYDITLHRLTDHFFLLGINIPEEEIEKMREALELVRPITCPLTLTRKLPPGTVEVPDSQSYKAEIWLNDQPWSVSAINNALGLADPTLPMGSIDFNLEKDSWEFKSPFPLSDIEKENLKNAAQTLGISNSIEFTHSPESFSFNKKNKTPTSLPSSLDIIVSRSINLSKKTRELVAMDEDNWRDFLAERQSQTLTIHPPPLERTENFTCLYDTSDHSDIRIAELLTIYDRIELIPNILNSSWLDRHQLSLSDLQELVRLKRFRIVLPHSAERYDSRLLAAIAEVDPTALILSRTLATKTILTGQRKDPLLYGPFNASQRLEILRHLRKTSTSSFFDSTLSFYGKIFASQHYGFATRGALSCLGGGVGAYLGDLFFTLRGIDARIELMDVGAHIEWALGLGASYIPRAFEAGYDETRNANLVASFLNRVPISKEIDPVADRMHSMVDGLLAISSGNPLDIAKNFSGPTVLKFRKLASDLMHQAPTREQMQETVNQINRETLSYEKRKERLRVWKLDALAFSVAMKPVGDLIDNQLGGLASVAAWHIYDILKSKIPDQWTYPIRQAAQSMTQLALAPSLDAVIVSRSRAQLAERK